MTSLLLALLKFLLLMTLAAGAGILIGSGFATATQRWKRLRSAAPSTVDPAAADAMEARTDFERGQRYAEAQWQSRHDAGPAGDPAGEASGGGSDGGD